MVAADGHAVTPPPDDRFALARAPRQFLPSRNEAAVVLRRREQPDPAVKEGEDLSKREKIKG
jgi:hypothetical protein